MSDGLWLGRQDDASSNDRGRDTGATTHSEIRPGEAGVVTTLNGQALGVTESEAGGTGSGPVDLFAASAARSGTQSIEEHPVAIESAARTAPAQPKRGRRGLRRLRDAEPDAASEPASPLVETFRREGARRNAELMETLERAERATSEARRLRQAVTAAEGEGRLAVEQQAEVRSRIEEERRAEQDESDRRL